MASTSSNVGGGKPNPFVVWADRLDDLFFPPPLAANEEEDGIVCVCGEAVTVIIGLLTAKPSTNCTAFDDTKVNANTKSKDLS